MQLLDSWKNSLKFFERKNLSMMSLVTLKAIKYTYQHIIKYLGVPLVLMAFISMVIVPRMSGQVFYVWQLISWIAKIFFLVFVYLTVRSSVMKKDWLYYRTFLVPGIVVAFELAVILALLHWFGYYWWLIINIPVTFFILFSLDSELFDVGHKRSDKMIFYNLPVCIVVALALAVMWYVCMLIIHLFSTVVPISVENALLLFIPVEACVLSNLYIKWLHEQFDLYYTQKAQKEVGV